jgi:hypothetical protein
MFAMPKSRHVVGEVWVDEDVALLPTMLNQ